MTAAASSRAPAPQAGTARAPGSGGLPEGRRHIVLVGLMGAGKSCIGRRLAARLGRRFLDADNEIEAAAGCSIAEIFERHGEPAFRDGERRVIARLLDTAEPIVLATGGGAYMDPDTRAAIRASGVAVWLRAELELLLRRTARRDNRPLLRRDDPRKVLSRLIEERHPRYAEADLTVDSLDGPVDATLERLLQALRSAGWLGDADGRAGGRATGGGAPEGGKLLERT